VLECRHVEVTGTDTHIAAVTSLFLLIIFISALDQHVLLGRLIGRLGDAGFVEEHGGAHLFVAGQLFVAVGA